MVVAYRPGADGVLRPEPPAEGPCRDAADGPCRLVEDHWRERVTGPCFALLVLRCLAHRRGFTLYPFGHVPYGREPVAPVAPDGQPLGNGGPDRFAGTVFGAAIDAARGIAWRRESDIEDGSCWPTMCRRLSAAETWLGVAPHLTDREREARAADLDVDLLPLLEGARAIAAAPGYRSRGAAVMRILTELPEGPALLTRLLRAGHGAGLLGEPMVPVRPRGPLRSLARERPFPRRCASGPDPPRERDADTGAGNS